MLDVNRSRAERSQTGVLGSTVASLEEGTLMVSIVENGKGVLVPSTGTSTELIAGISRMQMLTPTVGTRVEVVTIPATSTYTVTLGKTPLLPATRVAAVLASGTPLAYGAGGTPSTGEFKIAGAVVTFNSAQAGLVVTITYKYNLTVTEAQMLYGQGVGDAAIAATNSIEIITAAQAIYTDKFDPSANWAAGGSVYSGANGEFTKTNTGTLINNCYVIEAPSAASNGFLGLYFSV